MGTRSPSRWPQPLIVKTSVCRARNSLIWKGELGNGTRCRSESAFAFALGGRNFTPSRSATSYADLQIALHPFSTLCRDGAWRYDALRHPRDRNVESGGWSFYRNRDGHDPER